MKVQELKVVAILPYGRNNKFHDDIQVERIANSIKEFWFVQPVVVDKDNVLIIGHWRLLAAKQLGLQTVPAVKLEELTEEQVKKLRILDNKLNESERNIEAIQEEIQDLWDEMIFWDISIPMIDLFQEEMKGLHQEERISLEEDEVPEVQEAKVVQKWDLFQLWNHRLLCWDSSLLEDQHLLLDWATIDMVFTDPPYNISYQWVSDKRKIKNDSMDGAQFLAFLKATIPVAEVCYVCCSWQYAHLFKQAMTELWMPPKAMIVRDKVNPAQNLDKYYKQHELLFYYWKFGWEQTLRWDVRQVKRQKNTVHPTMKPLELIWMALQDNPDKQVVYDWFWGSWSTMIACEQLGKTCYMMELDPAYIEVIIKRFHNLNPDADIQCLTRTLDIQAILSD